MKGIWLIIGAALISSCQTLPVISSPALPEAETVLTCPAPFLTGKFRLIHSIEAITAGNPQNVVIGVTLADSASRVISCAIMTAEGMVLFEAQSGSDWLKINRALPPFDSESFARNLMDDIKLIFFAPSGNIIKRGTYANGKTACRWRGDNGVWIDVLADAQGGAAEIRLYSSCGSLQRLVKLGKDRENPYSNIELQAKELLDYALVMTLIESQPVEDERPVGGAKEIKK